MKWELKAKKQYEMLYQFLIRYIEMSMNGRDSYFICIPGLEDDFIEYLDTEYLCDSKDNIKVIPVKVSGANYDFYKAVIARNNKNIKKVAVITNRTINLIDSLKDFVEIDIKKLKYKDIRYVLESVLVDHLGTAFTDFFNNENGINTNNYKNHLEYVFDELKPELSCFIEYIVKFITDYDSVNEVADLKIPTAKIKYLVMNANLDILGVWTSLSVNYIGKIKFKKMIKCSNPIIIQNKIYNPEDINKLKPPSGMNKIKKLVGIIKDRSYSESSLKEILKGQIKMDKSILSNVYYEFVESFFEGENGIVTRSKVKKESDPFVNLYDAVIYFLIEEDKNITDYEYIKYEDKIFDPQNTETIYEMFGKMEQDFFNFLKSSIDFNESANREEKTNIYKLNITFKPREGKEIHKIRRFDCELLIKNFEHYNKLLSYIDEESLFVQMKDGNNPIRITFEYLLEKLEMMNLSSEEKLNLNRLLLDLIAYRKDVIKMHYIKFDFIRVPKAILYAKSYFEILRTIHSYKNRALDFRESGFLTYFLNIDSIAFDDQIQVSCFNPVEIYYCESIRKQYINFITSFKKHKGLWKDIMEDIAHQCKNERVIYKNNVYYINSNELNENNFFAKYIPESSIDSFISIDTYKIFTKLMDYIDRFPYKNTINIGIVGKVDALKLKKLLISILSKPDQNVSEFNINFVSISSDFIRTKFLEDSESQEKLRKNVKYSFTDISEVSDKEMMIRDLVINNDLVFLFDPLIMYNSVEIKPINNQNIIETRSASRSIESDIEILSSYSNFIRRDIPIMPELLNTIHILEYYGKNTNGQWNNYNLNPNIIRAIKETIKLTGKYIKDKVVYFYSGDSEIIKQIYDFSYIDDIEQEINEVNKISLVSFSPNLKERSIPSKGYDNTQFYMSEYLALFTGLNEEIISNDDNELMSIIKDLLITIDYSELPNKLMVAYESLYLYLSDENENDDIHCRIISTIEKLIKTALNPEDNIEYTVRSMFENFLVSKSTSIGQLLYIHMLRNNYSYIRDIELQIKYSEGDGFIFLFEEDTDSISNYYILNLMNLLDTKLVSERDEKKMESLFRNKDELRQVLNYIKYTYELNFIDNKSTLSENLKNITI